MCSPKVHNSIIIYPHSSPVLCISLVLLSTPTIDYCRKDLCSRGTTHIACNAPLKFGPSCSGKKPKVIPMRNSMKRVLLHEHNRLRAQVASGDLRGYSSASRMPTLTWDGQLQFVAGCNARLCRFEHDKCRSTAQFRWAGQNLAMKSLFGRWRSVRVNQMLQEFVRGWFAEHKDANQAIIDRFPAKYKGLTSNMLSITFVSGDYIPKSS
ncbi:conserved hypothetical protein [Culex quinquefasciatus]|uniref:SCP domain-containing protein n=1 Tax=Culex quinquefasciatus TaxID=7176 RepID=B0WNN1_CULQU|nr:conserved hypothetical protein [Culex quinquefasciatus]|eukprot:XP_001850315.1 conserved hypothetical protein [Culex quinquefasciatus]